MNYIYYLNISSDIGSEDLWEIVGDVETSNQPEKNTV